MNPFLESTVAKPLSTTPVLTPLSRRQASLPSHKPVRRRLTRPYRLWRKGDRMPAQAFYFGIGVGLLVLATCYPRAAFAVDVNSADVSQLMSVRGIGPKTAQLIMAERQRGGAFESWSDLSDRVKGIGSKKTAALQAAGLTLKAAAMPDAASKQTPD